jgi:hypothetical protein
VKIDSAKDKLATRCQPSLSEIRYLLSRVGLSSKLVAGIRL